MNKKNKKAVSLMISYVILVAIVIAMSIAVFTWLKIISNIEPVASCEEGTSMIVNDYKCGDTFELDLKNNGRFSINGFILTVGDTDGRVPIIRLIPLENESLDKDGFFVFETPLVPGKDPEAEKTVVFTNVEMKSNGSTAEFDINSTKNMRIQPFVIDKESLEKIVCEDAVIKQDVDCQKDVIPPASNPEDYIHYWRFEDDGNDDVADSDSHFQLVGGTGEYVNGKVDKAFEFDGATSIKVPDNKLGDITDDEVSISFWIKSKSPSIKRIINKKDSANKGFLLKGDSSSLSLIASGIGDNWLKCDINNFNDNWHFIVLTAKKDGKKKIYVYDNSVEKTTCENNAGSNGLDSTKNLFLGNRAFIGTIDDLKIWNRELTQGEVEALFDSY